MADSYLDPEAIALSYLQVVRQPRSAWTWEVELRPWVERFRGRRRVAARASMGGAILWRLRSWRPSRGPPSLIPARRGSKAGHLPPKQSHSKRADGPLHAYVAEIAGEVMLSRRINGLAVKDPIFHTSADNSDTRHASQLRNALWSKFDATGFCTSRDEGLAPAAESDIRRASAHVDAGLGRSMANLSSPPPQAPIIPRSIGGDG
jgi:hypothetical protein